MNTANQQNSIASILTEVAAEGGLIPIFPAGIVIGYDGRGPYSLTNADAVIAASKRAHVDLVIDRDHVADAYSFGKCNPAAGWIKELINQDGSIVARVEWTPAAQKQLADKEYRYISPTFSFNTETREVTRILRATLTNTPNFDMKAVASALTADGDDIFNQNQQENFRMKQLIIALASTLGLAAETADVDVVKAATKKLTDLQTEMASIRSALKLDEKADSKQVLDVATSLTTKSQADPDPSKFVPITALTELSGQLKKVQDSLAADKASAEVDSAMKAGKITPAQKDWALAYASQNPEEFKKYVASAPVITGAVLDAGKPVYKAGEVSLSPDDIALCSMMGVTPEDFKKQREAELKAAAA